ncbi:hypothetical protein SETIT_8G231000v2 [Setaria italica]|uniref:Knottin scorpion toxin-like domain-containing protein n=1 Tax=Setaria italica TaxID=4555 RepID=A0A368SAX5_SETIT|nr:hypothetical protein SETIT_8G231000v2 [Setaria italica]
MAHSAGKNLSALLILLVAMAAVAGRIHPAESASMQQSRIHSPCKEHPSANYKGMCLGVINDSECNSVCLDESSDNMSGSCAIFMCWCQIRCTSETVVAASAPTLA